MSVKVSLRRTQIEKQLNAAAAELAATRAAIRETREKKFSELEAVATFPSATDGLVLAAQVATAEAEFKEKQRQKLEALGADERSELKRIDGLYADLDRLRSEVRSAYPEPPSWWRDKVDCAACPSPADVADALR